MIWDGFCVKLPVDNVLWGQRVLSHLHAIVTLKCHVWLHQPTCWSGPKIRWYASFLIQIRWLAVTSFTTFSFCLFCLFIIFIFIITRHERMVSQITMTGIIFYTWKKKHKSFGWVFLKLEERKAMFKQLCILFYFNYFTCFLFRFNFFYLIIMNFSLITKKKGGEFTWQVFW